MSEELSPDTFVVHTSQIEDLDYRMLYGNAWSCIKLTKGVKFDFVFVSMFRLSMLFFRFYFACTSMRCFCCRFDITEVCGRGTVAYYDNCKDSKPNSAFIQISRSGHYG